jgi:hypothetical protein
VEEALRGKVREGENSFAKTKQETEILKRENWLLVVEAIAQVKQEMERANNYFHIKSEEKTKQPQNVHMVQLFALANSHSKELKLLLDVLRVRKDEMSYVKKELEGEQDGVVVEHAGKV